MRLICTLVAALLSSGVSAAALLESDTLRYEVVNNMPLFYQQMKEQLTYPAAWGNAPETDFARWRAEARAKVDECLQNVPPAPSGWAMRTVATEQREGYEVRKIEFNISAWSRVPAYLLVPEGHEGERLPAVVMLHDHGAHFSIGKEKMVRPFDDDSLVIADADEWVDNIYGGQFMGDYLARHGYVVFSTDAPMWGERGRKEGVDRNKYDIIAGNMMMYGRCLSAFMTYDDIASTDFLATLPEVDHKRIACAGCSMGAYRSWMLAALSDKIAVCAAVCWMVTTDVQMTWKYGRKENGGFANCIPGLRQYLDYPHIASIACPKPMLFINGTQDKLFKIPGVEKAFGIMRDVWNSQGAGGNFEAELWPIPHSCGVEAQRRVLEFLDKHLKD